MGNQIQTANSTMQKRLALGLSAAILLSGMGMAQQRGGTLTVGLGYDIDTLNVYSTGFLGDVQATVAEGLVAPNEKAEYVPVLATRVPTIQNGGIKVAADNKSMVVTYQLRPGVKWSDGKPFTSADVKFTWETVKDPKFIAESKDGTEDISSISTPNDLTVVVNYKRVAPDFKSTLFTFGILPKHTLEGKDLNTDNYNQMPLGTGPFKVTQYVKGQFVVLDRNPFYWRKDKAGVQLPYLDKMIFKIIPDSNTLVTQLKSGEIQMATSVPYSQIPQLSAQAGLKVIKNPVLSWQHLDFNLKGPAALRDINVRKAVAHGLDRATISKALGGYPIPIDTVVVPVFSYSSKDVPKYPYDPAKAKQLLEAAGYKAGSDGIRAKNGQRLSFKIMAQAGRSTDEDAQQVMIAQMKAIGIELKPDNKAGVALRDARYKGDYDLYYAGWITSADPSYGVFYSTKGVNNGQGYSNPKVDALLATADSSLDPAVRNKALRDFQTVLMQDLPTIPVTSNPSMIVLTDKLGGFVSNPTNMTNFINTSGWYMKK
ncbi:peptide ABC transporter substrate-binding protein [Deinococcus sp. AJ005]|uniref:peptide ABC transporter substrate-binding protein n=1 Tax=Deinococcus sp. AJ005 TaxID=2652443 RepID=UPI001CF70DC0|nr:peptide ABC transporter substrate-binding protein [Deinococcus sp. AJ005]